MTDADQANRKPFISLRWKAVVALSLVLVAVNAWLAFLTNERALRQFELQQTRVHDQQSRQLRTMLDERSQEMSKLASLVPLLGTSGDAAMEERLGRALGENGALLDLEWAIRSVHWITPDGRVAIAWPEGTHPLPDEVLARIKAAPESTTSFLSCRPSCGQISSIPLLRHGLFAGSLVLERSLADALLAFRALTGAEIAIDVTDDPGDDSRLDPNDASHLDFPVVTYPQKSLPVLRAAGHSLMEMNRDLSSILVQQDGGWFEIVRINGLANDVSAYVINEVTAQREGIREATRDSLLIGLLGLFLSETLLLMIMQPPLHRLRDLAAALPLLAEKRYPELRGALARFGLPRLPRDEIDLMVETVGGLTERMERLEHDRKRAERQLTWLSDHDPLTQLMNRRRFTEDFERIVAQAARYEHHGALLLLDLDEFKDVNDLSGHQVGDALLQRVAEQLRSVTRPGDLLARLGGDEFALVLPEASALDAQSYADAAQEAVRSITLREHHRKHRISASIGIVTFPEQCEEIPQLMANADLAMYQAKDRGRGRWHLFSPEDPALAQLDNRILLKEQIAEALREDRFELHFQPIVNLSTGTACHAEALLRMRDPEQRLVFPDRFIPVAEKTGQIQGIDHWVLMRAFSLLADRDDLKLAVNLSANAMDDPMLLTNLERLLDRHAIEPWRLSFEVTETTAINCLSSATRLMRRIQELGCRIALDDFGTGYASYAYLRQLPIDDIKIDGIFIRDLASKPEDEIFVKSITAMAHGMGKRVIAEYVETAEILEILRNLGVDCAQGYFFGRPARLDDLRPLG